MGKIILIALVIGAGYGWNNGGLKEWLAEMVEEQRASLQSGPSTPPTAHQDAPAPPPGPPDSIRQVAASNADACARARSNVREIETWMRSGGKIVETGQRKTLSENETFSAISRERLFLEQNCGGR